MVDLNKYKEVLGYLNLGIEAEKFYSEKVIKKLDKTLSNQIYMCDLYNYFISHADDLKKVKLFTNDWYLIVAALIIEKDMYPRKYLIDPLYRLGMCLNTWIFDNKKSPEVVLTKDSIAKQFNLPKSIKIIDYKCEIK